MCAEGDPLWDLDDRGRAGLPQDPSGLPLTSQFIVHRGLLVWRTATPHRFHRAVCLGCICRRVGVVDETQCSLQSTYALPHRHLHLPPHHPLPFPTSTPTAFQFVSHSVAVMYAFAPAAGVAALRPAALVRFCTASVRVSNLLCASFLSSTSLFFLCWLIVELR